MITCKITADFDSANGDFSGFFKALTPLGAVLSVGDALFFGSTDGSADKKKVKKLLRKYGYEDSVIVEYGVSNPPHETDAINGWIFDHITQNAVMRLGEEHREAIKNGMKQLDEIDSLIKDQLQQLPEDVNEDAKKTEDTEVS